jgi:hypothetical protein
MWWWLGVTRNTQREQWRGKRDSDVVGVVKGTGRVNERKEKRSCEGMKMAGYDMIW